MSCLIRFCGIARDRIHNSSCIYGTVHFCSTCCAGGTQGTTASVGDCRGVFSDTRRHLRCLLDLLCAMPTGQTVMAPIPTLSTAAGASAELHSFSYQLAINCHASVAFTRVVGKPLTDSPGYCLLCPSVNIQEISPPPAPTKVSSFHKDFAGMIARASHHILLSC
ncbi:UNVERIFIED_CONTAM: hypothetical protein HHA_453090 [Hammondia hammondi]|eukprot:XP_008886362.1 hypothetical protein HHA_453090 [Hammondia hammondi]